MSQPLSHDKIVDLLANHLRTRLKPPMVFTEVALEGSYGSMGRLDVVILQTASHYTKNAIWGYEVKATRSDLIHDIDTRKFEKYLSPLQSFFFVYPAGLLEPSQVPDPCGVILYYPETKVWRTVKRSQPLDSFGKGPDIDTFIRLLWRANDMIWHRADPKTRLERMKDFEETNDLRYRLSRKANEVIHDAAAVKSSYENTIKHERETLEAERKALQEAPKILDDISYLLQQAAGAVSVNRWGYRPENETAKAISVLADQLRAERQKAYAS